MFLKGKLLFVLTEKLKKLLITIEIQNIMSEFCFSKNSFRITSSSKMLDKSKVFLYV